MRRGVADGRGVGAGTESVEQVDGVLGKHRDEREKRHRELAGDVLTGGIGGEISAIIGEEATATIAIALTMLVSLMFFFMLLSFLWCVLVCCSGVCYGAAVRTARLT